MLLPRLQSGGALFDTVSQHGRLALPLARRYFRQIVSGVAVSEGPSGGSSA